MSSRRATTAEGQAAAVAPKCPKCKTPMRRDRTKRRPFWECLERMCILTPSSGRYVNGIRVD
jgi:hypothetical protein